MAAANDRLRALLGAGHASATVLEPAAALFALLLLYLSFGFELSARAGAVCEQLTASLAGFALLRHALGACISGEAGPLGYLNAHRFGVLVSLSLSLSWLFEALGLLPFAWLLEASMLLALIDLVAARAARVLVFSSRHLRLAPALIVVLSFLLVIALGALLLSAPRASAPGRGLTPLDALFTATSATCVTGLALRDTGTELTTFGQIVVLALIQIGGLGLMTLASFFALSLGQGLGLREGLVLRDALNLKKLSEARPLLFFILKATLVIEALGALALYFAIGEGWAADASVAERCFSAVFHSVSAFCNAGFSTFPRALSRPGPSLEAFVASPMVLGVFSVLIVLGGLGFLVLLWLGGDARRRWARMRGLGSGLVAPAPGAVHVRLVLWTSGLLLLAGAWGFMAFEPREPGVRGACLGALTAGFQSVTARTAGFNSVPYAHRARYRCVGGAEQSVAIGDRGVGEALSCPGCGELRRLKAEEVEGGLSQASLFLMIALMFVGASPGSTGGGAKTVTVAVLALAVLAQLRQRRRVEVGRRALDSELVTRALVIVFLSAVACALAALALSVTERGRGPCGGDWRFLDLLFEAVSAVATVGLSTGVTASLSAAGKGVVIAAMFFGRVGPLTLVLSLAAKPRGVRYQYPRAAVMIG